MQRQRPIDARHDVVQLVHHSLNAWLRERVIVLRTTVIRTRNENFNSDEV